jgi:hypothetical protein
LRQAAWQDHLNTPRPGDHFNDGVRQMRQHAGSQRMRIRYSPYLVNAFGGVDLRIFSYSEDDVRRLIERRGRQVILQYLRALYGIYQYVDRLIDSAVGEVQRQVYQRIRREIEASVVQWAGSIL